MRVINQALLLFPTHSTHGT